MEWAEARRRRGLRLTNLHLPDLCPTHTAQELEALRGGRYAASLALEALDVAAPLLAGLLARAGAAASWLLVRLIGRALGLVYRGVRQSLAPRPPRPPRPEAAWAD